jgi:hypothetical protein
MDLKEVLKELIPCIKGDYFIGDGALLGLIREKQLLVHDHDIDLYLMPGSTIDLNNSPLQLQNWYLCDKVFHPMNPKVKVNNWTEFMSYKRTTTMSGMNRSELMLEASHYYRDEKIIPHFTDNHIDIFYLDKESQYKYVCPIWSNVISNLHFKFQEIYPLLYNNDLGFNVKIPFDSVSILKRQYGNNCLDYVDKDWKWLK